MSAYYLKGIAPPHIQLWTIFKGCFPFLGMVLLTIVLVYLQPKIVTWLPDLMYSNTVAPMEIAPGEEGSVMDPSFLGGGTTATESAAPAAEQTKPAEPPAAGGAFDPSFLGGGEKK